MSPKLTKLIGVRVDHLTATRLEKFESETGMDAVTLARAAVVACLDYYSANRRISLPLRIIPEGASNISHMPADRQTQGLRVAEDPAPYRHEKQPHTTEAAAEAKSRLKRKR